MRVPHFRQFAKYSQAFALVLCGIIIGAASYMIVYQHNMNVLAEENDTLQKEINNLEEDIQSLDKYKDNDQVIKKVLVEIEDDPDITLDQVTSNEIKERVRKKFNVLIGKKIEYLANPDTTQILRMLFGEHRLSDVQGYDYIAEVHSIIVLYSELKVRISVKEWDIRE